MLVTIPLRRGDIDDMGHVSQYRYHQLLGEARGAVLNSGADAADFVLGYVELRHLGETKLEDGPMEIDIRINEIGESSVKMEHELRAGGRPVASGRSVMVAWDTRQKGKRPITSAERAGLERALVPSTS